MKGDWSTEERLRAIHWIVWMNSLLLILAAASLLILTLNDTLGP